MSYLSSVLPLAFITGTKPHLFSPQLFIKSCAIHHISVSLKIMKSTESLQETIWKLKKKSPSPRISEQMNLLIGLIAICSNLKYGYSFPFCRKALTLLNTGNGVFKESTGFEVRCTGIQGNEQKEPVLAAYDNSLHYFVTTA